MKTVEEAQSQSWADMVLPVNHEFWRASYPPEQGLWNPPPRCCDSGSRLAPFGAETTSRLSGRLKTL